MEDGKRHAQTDTFNIKIADFNPFVIPSNASLWPVLFKENVSKFRLAYSRCFCIHFTEEKNHLGTSSFIISQVFIWSRFVTMNDIVIIAFMSSSSSPSSSSQFILCVFSLLLIAFQNLVNETFFRYNVTLQCTLSAFCYLDRKNSIHLSCHALPCFSDFDLFKSYLTLLQISLLNARILIFHWYSFLLLLLLLFANVYTRFAKFFASVKLIFEISYECVCVCVAGNTNGV